uniref:Large ribosomal subunit protein bL12 C-terminal domain-containing protein n=1 Tax=Grammatophora oceanica TaxID=210454 RepID=A0A7S1VJG3_9STRA|mmetsp:Transcript_46949/g.69823  ORF Transcript_46949/g.69823 Transcript_46949/m.69823 type:complete len:193 (+) Transcript_46949:90-668(+)
MMISRTSGARCSRALLGRLRSPASATVTRATTSMIGDHFSSQAGPTEPAEVEFQSDKVKDLFAKMKDLEKEEVTQVSKLVFDRLGIELLPEELDPSLRAAAVAAAGIPGGGEEEEDAPKEEKTTFDVKLVGFDAKAKIKVIKEVRSIVGLGLKEAKELVDGAPKVVQKGVSKEAAEEFKTKIEAVGGQIELE